MAWVGCALAALLLLLRPAVVIGAASQACALFAASVLPGLYPYMILLLLLLDRLPTNAPFPALVLLGWGAGSPCGAKICAARGASLPPRQQKRLLICCGTMSPMFLYGTLGQWLRNGTAGLCILLAVLSGGLAVSTLIRCGKDVPSSRPQTLASPTLTLGTAVEKASVTLLTVCGCMVLGNVFSALLPALFPALPAQAQLAVSCLLEVTTASKALAALPVPLPLRVALLSGETGFGALAILMQNRALGPQGVWSLPQQLGFQLLHGLVSALLGYALALLLL